MSEMSNYGYHCNIKELAEEVKKQYACLEENTEKYIIFSVPIEKEITRTDKNEKNNYSLSFSLSLTLSLSLSLSLSLYIYIYIYIYT